MRLATKERNGQMRLAEPRPLLGDLMDDTKTKHICYRRCVMRPFHPEVLRDGCLSWLCCEAKLNRNVLYLVLSHPGDSHPNPHGFRHFQELYTPKMPTQEWGSILNKKKERLQAEKSLKFVDIADFATFEATLARMYDDYANKKIAKFVNEKLSPHFEHIRSFERAIAASTQCSMYSTLIWGGLQMVIEVFSIAPTYEVALTSLLCTCRFADSLNHIGDMLQELHSCLPDFEVYMMLYPKNPGLVFALRDIYEDYADYCICIVKFLKHGALRMYSRTSTKRLLRSTDNIKGQILRGLFYSSSRQEMLRIKAHFIEHKAKFNSTAELAHRMQAQRNHAEIMMALPTAVQTSSHSEKLAVKFPLHTILLQRNRHFFGRETTLDKLKHAVNQANERSKPTVCAVNGIGGLGKTQTVLEFAYRQLEQKAFDCVFWLTAETNFDLSKTYCAIGRKLRLFEGGVDQAKIEQVCEWLESTGMRSINCGREAVLTFSF
jgi:hypothetical protein